MLRLVAEAQSAHRSLERILVIGEYRTLRTSEGKSRQLVSRAHLSTSGQPRVTVYFANHLSPDPPTATSVRPPTGYGEQEADHQVKLAKTFPGRRKSAPTHPMEEERNSAMRFYHVNQIWLRGKRYCARSRMPSKSPSNRHKRVYGKGASPHEFMVEGPGKPRKRPEPSFGGAALTEASCRNIYSKRLFGLAGGAVATRTIGSKW